MPALKPTDLPSGFLALAEDRKSHNEHRDCTVVAMTITTGLPYAVCHKALSDAGRANRRGTHFAQQRKAYEALGFNLREWSSAEIIGMVQSYPKKGIAGLTTHQPRRFPKAWAAQNGKALLLYSRGHVSAMVGGVVQDWAINRAKQVWRVVEVTKA